MIKPLTSFRFFFALLVFASHLGFLAAANGPLNQLYRNVLHEGYLGVSFFFILSGFVLALSYKKRLTQQKITTREFWIARVARVYPLHLFTLLLAIPLSFKELLASPLVWAGTLLLNALLLQSFVPVETVFFSFNAPSWSISDEMFFYSLFPFIILFLSRYKWSVYLGCLLLLAIPLAMHFTPVSLHHPLFYVNPIFRVADFIIGILLYNIYESKVFDAILRQRITATVLEAGTIGLFITFVAFHNYIPQVYRFSCYYWLPMVLIIFVFAYQAGYLSVVLSKKIFVLLGEISFGFYLIHQLVIRYASIVNSHVLHLKNNYILIAVIFAVALTASYISFNLIEKPANRYIKKRFIV